MNKIKIACIGDSNTYGFKLIKRSKHSYPAELQKLLGDNYEVMNFGLIGYCVQNSSNLPYKDHDYFKKSIEYNADIVLLMLGSNDTKQKNWRDMNYFINEYETILEQYKNSTIIIMTPMKINEGVLKTLNKRQIFMDSKCKLIAPILEKKYANTYTFLNTYELTKNNELIFQADGIHINKKGTKLLAQTCYEIINKMKSKN